MAEDGGNDPLRKCEPCAVNCFRTVRRSSLGHAFTPRYSAVRIHKLQKHDPAIIYDAICCDKRLDERQQHLPQ